MDKNKEMNKKEKIDFIKSKINKMDCMIFFKEKTEIWIYYRENQVIKIFGVNKNKIFKTINKQLTINWKYFTKDQLTKIYRRIRKINHILDRRETNDTKRKTTKN